MSGSTDFFIEKAGMLLLTGLLCEALVPGRNGLIFSGPRLALAAKVTFQFPKLRDVILKSAPNQEM